MQRSLGDLIRAPIVLAPMAGGPGTPRLAAAVAEAGGLPFLAGGYKSPAAVRSEIEELRALTGAPFGVNVFVPQPPEAPAADLEAYRERLIPEARRLGVELGEPAWDDDGWEAKLALLAADPVPLVSFTFGCPSADVIRSLQQRRTLVAITVTAPEEAQQAAAAGADALCVQGAQAGAHQGSFDNAAPRDVGLLPLVAAVRRAVSLPLIAAGGIMRGEDVAAVLAAGASAAQLGTAFLRCPESGTSEAHRRALGDPRFTATAVTRAFTGRWARGLVNRFILEHGSFAPRAYPHVHHMTRELRRVAAKRLDLDVLHLWAGQGFALAEERPAGEIVERLRRQARAILGRFRS